MNRDEAIGLIEKTFKNPFDEDRFRLFARNLLNGLDESEALDNYVISIPEAYKGQVKRYKCLGKYIDSEGIALDILVVNLEKETALDQARTKQRNFIAWYLKKRGAKDAALVAFHTDGLEDWRFSFVRMDYRMVEEGGKVKLREDLTPARRYSFLVGKNEPNHTAQQQLLPIMQDEANAPTLAQIEDAFSIEKVTKEFYTQVALKFTELVGGKRKVGSKNIVESGLLFLPSTKDDTIKKEFAVRLIGRLLFCWFLKKKKSNKDVPLISTAILSSNAVVMYSSYYHAVLEPLFFQALNTPVEKRNKRVANDPWDKIPFLNGGLFEPHAHDFYDIDVLGTSKFLNILKIPDNWFIGLFKIFEDYNFTIDESSTIDIEISVDPEMLGRIFENLLAEINPETGDTARRSTGSYYTPRPIVEFMVDESLKQYLITHTKIDEKKIAHLLSYAEDDMGMIETEREAIIDALDIVKIIDPACGSGAFPMGILHKMLLILQKIDPESKKWLSKKLPKIDNKFLRREVEAELKRKNWNYIHKLGIIQYSIYGVDIQPIAVEISKLRFFLSLIVDERIDDAKHNRGIVPLPNLEFKFVVANSLIGLPKLFSQAKEGEKVQDLFGESKDDIEKLKELRETYFTASGADKKKIEKEFKETQDKMFIYALKWQALGSQTMQLSEWDPFGDKQSEWFDTEWMFGVKDGFDIVIGNPPYLESRHPSFNEELKDKYQSEATKRWGTLSKKITRGSDLLIYFFEIGLYLINQKGVVVLITQNSWLNSDYGSKFQDFLLEVTNVKAIIDSDFKYFDSSAGPNINTVISIFYGKRKQVKDFNTIIFSRYHSNFEKIPHAYREIETLIKNKYATVHTFKYSDERIRDIKWGILLNSEEYILDLINIIRAKAGYLEDLHNMDLRVGQGLNLSKEYVISNSCFDKAPLLITAAIPFMTSEDGAPFVLKKTMSYLIDRNKLNAKTTNIMNAHNLKAYDLITTKPEPVLIMPRGIGRHFCAINLASAYSGSCVDIYDYKNNASDDVILNLWLFLNSSVLWLLREISGRKNLGGGMLKAEATDLKSFPIYMPFDKKNDIKRIYEKLEKREAKETIQEIDTVEHKCIDKIVFEYLGISSELQDKVVSYLKMTIDKRQKKAKT